MGSLNYGIDVATINKISDEISTTSGYEFNNQNRILATSGKKKYEFDITKDSFAWIKSNSAEKKKIKTFASYSLVKTMRAGILVLGPLLSKYKKALAINLPPREAIQYCFRFVGYPIIVASICLFLSLIHI